MDQGQSIKFTANVSNDSSNKGVTWSLSQNGSSCSPGCGTISPATTPSGQPATYSAPATINANLQFNVTATSVADSTKSQTDVTTAVPPPSLNNPATLPAATVGQAYSFQLAETGGVAPLSWSITSGTLPAGLTLNTSTGIISGTPTAQAMAKNSAMSIAPIPAAAPVQICFTLQVLDSGNPPLKNSQQLCLNVASAAGAPSQLAFIQQPMNVGALTSIAPAVTVAIEDASGNVVTTANVYVTVAIGTNPSSGTLTGATTQAAVGGVATFPNLEVNMPGKGYTLVARATGLTSVTSNPFDVTVSVTVAPEKNCGTLGVPVNGTCLFVATALGDNGSGVTWSLNDQTGCPGATCGTLLPLGRGNLAAGDIDVYRYAMLYFGPDNTLNFPSTVAVTATSVLDPTQSGSATISLTQLAPTIGIVAPLGL